MANTWIHYKTTVVNSNLVRLWIIEHPYEGAQEVCITLTMNDIDQMREMLTDAAAEEMKAGRKK